MVSGLLNTYGSRDQSDDIIYQHLLPRGISGVSFCFIPCVEQISEEGDVHFKQVIAGWNTCLLVC